MGLGCLWRSAWAPWRHGTFAWQARHLVTSAFVSRGRRGSWRRLPSFHVAGLALMGLGWLWWRASAFVSHGRRTTWRHLTSFHLAGVALMGLGWLWWHAWAPCRRGPFAWQARHLVSFTWQAWHLATSTFVSRGRHGTYGTGLPLAARLGAVAPRHFCVAGAALGDICLRFTWQAWHLATSTFVSRGRHGTYGTGLPLVARLGTVAPRHFCLAGAALGDICLRFTNQRVQINAVPRGTWITTNTCEKHK